MTEETPAQEIVEEEVDAVLVAAEPRAVEPLAGALAPVSAAPLAVQAAAVAATGFAAGAMTVAVVRHHRVKKADKQRRRAAQRHLTSVIASRSFLVDVHLLGGRDN